MGKDGNISENSLLITVQVIRTIKPASTGKLSRGVFRKKIRANTTFWGTRSDSYCSSPEGAKQDPYSSPALSNMYLPAIHGF